jgi:ribosomal protein S18 acetylase RimI-like enzyme
MLKAKDVCFANGCRRLKWEVEEDNISAIRFYERLGAEVNIKGVCRWGEPLPT